MKRSTLVLGSISLLSVGMAAGVTVMSWNAGQRLDAASAAAQTLDREYQELDSPRNILLEQGRYLNRVVRLTTPSVVHIQSTRRNERRAVVEETGSGVIVESSKVSGPVIVTNRHVVGESELESINIRLWDGRTVHPKKVIADKATDLAVMLVDVTNVRPARWGNSARTEIGDFAMAVGSPFGLSQSATLGIISAKGRRSLRLGCRASVLNQDFLQTDAAINPGSSGGPLFDMRGMIVGINTAIASNSEGNDGIGFSIPSNLARRIVDQLLEHGKVQRAYLGVKLDSDFNLASAQRLKLDRPRGARILEVYAETPASRARLNLDDVVLSFDGLDVQDENHLINLVSLTPVGTHVNLVVYRDGRRVTVPIDLADRSELEQRAEKGE